MFLDLRSLWERAGGRVRALVVRLARVRRVGKPHVIFTRPTGYTTANPPVRPTLVKLVRIKRTPGRVLLKRPFGHATINPPIRPLLVADVRIRRRPAFLARFIRPVFHPVVVVARHVLAIRVVLVRIRRRPPTLVRFLKPIGRHATIKPPIRPITVADVRIRRRPPTLVRFIKPVFHPVILITRHVRGLTVLLARIRRQPWRIKPKFTPVFGYTTAKPPVRRLLVLLARIKRPVILSTRFTKLRAIPGVVVARFPKRLRVLLARRLPLRRTLVKFLKPIGRHTTVKPPIRAIQVVRQVRAAREKRPRTKTHIIWLHVFGYVTRKLGLRPLRVLLARRARQPGRLARLFRPILIRPVAQFLIFPFGPLIIWAPTRARTRGAVRFIRPIGRPSTIRRPRRPVVLLAPSHRPPSGHVRVVRQIGRHGTLPPPLRLLHAPVVRLAPGRKPTRGSVRLGRPVGRHATPPPPVRPIKVVGIRRRALRALRTRLGGVVRTHAAVFTITGITRDCGGSALGFCQVLLYRTSDHAFIASTTSDVNGHYSFTVGDGTTQYFLVAYFPDAPDVAGTTRNDVVGV